MLKRVISRLKRLPRKYKIIGVILVLVVLFFIFRGRNKPTSIETTSVRKNHIESQVSASGILTGKNTASLRFRTSGKLQTLNVKVGDIVRKGQVIGSLDSKDLSIALQQAQNTLRDKQAVVDNIHDQVKDHGSDETFAQKSLRTTAEVAKDNAYDNVRAAQNAIQNTVIYSPFAGVVVAQDDVNVGQNVSPTDLIAQVVDFSRKDMSADIDESDIGKIKVGQEAEVTLNAYGDKQFKGKVVQIKSQTKTSSTGSITVTVKIELSDNSILAIYGLNGQANIITHSKEDVMTIPQEALISDNEAYVKTAEGKFLKRTLEIGLRSDNEIEVLSGLNEGELVVINPSVVPLK